MAGDKRILTDLLLDAAEARAPANAEELSERLRAALLLNSSNSPTSCARADGIAYATAKTWRGVVIRGSEVSLSQFADSLTQLEAVPPGLAAREPELEAEDFCAAMKTVAALLRGFEGPRKPEPESG